MNTNGYFKWITLTTTLFMVIISGSFTYTLVTNKRIDRLDDRILQVLEGQYKISAKMDYMIDHIDGENNVRNKSALASKNPDLHNGNQFVDNARTLIRTCYLLLFDSEIEKKNQVQPEYDKGS